MALSLRTSSAGAPLIRLPSAVLAFLCAAALLLASATGHAAEIHGRVVGVSDGDTITVIDVARVQHRIRLAGIDAPERRQAYGERAKQRLAALVLHRDVTVVWQKQDRYGRIVGRVLVPECPDRSCTEKHDAGLSLITAGLAWHYKQYQNEQEPAERERYAAAEERARRNQAGLWRDVEPIPPWHFRRQPGSAQARPAAPSL